MSLGLFVNTLGTFYSNAPPARSVQFVVEDSQFVRVHAEFSVKDGRFVAFDFDVLLGRCTTIDLRGWDTIKFSLDDRDINGIEPGLLVNFRDATLTTDNLVIYKAFGDTSGDGFIDGQYLPRGAFDFICNEDSPGTLWQAPEGSHEQDIKAGTRYPVRGNYMAPTVPCSILFFLKF